MGEAKFCPNCGSPRAGEAEVPSPDSETTTRASNNLVEKWQALTTAAKAAIAAGVVGVLVISLAVLGVFENGDIAQCKRLVKDSLKSPSTARFQEASVTYDKAGDTGEKTISVEGTVEAQNGFGAQITAKYWCTNYNTDELELEYVSSK